MLGIFYDFEQLNSEWAKGGPDTKKVRTKRQLYVEIFTDRKEYLQTIRIQARIMLNHLNILLVFQDLDKDWINLLFRYKAADPVKSVQYLIDCLHNI